MTAAAHTPRRVVVAGALGRMGSLAVRAVAAEPGLTLAGELTRHGDPAALLDPAEVDILLDLTVAEASRSIAPLAARRGIAPVVGTSGLNARDLETLREACERGRTGGLVIPNFAIGAVRQMKAAGQLAAYLEGGEIHEIHHPAKRDTPSGTARATAECMLQGALRRDPSASEPRIRSERIEGVLARQIVTFDSGAERIVLDHEVRDRVAYMPGLLLALRSVSRLRGLHVGLDAVLDGDLARARERLV